MGALSPLWHPSDVAVVVAVMFGVPRQLAHATGGARMGAPRPRAARRLTRPRGGASAWAVRDLFVTDDWICKNTESGNFDLDLVALLHIHRSEDFVAPHGLKGLAGMRR